MTYYSQTRSGFSLIEIMVAIAIVGIMGAVGFGLFRYIARAKITASETELLSVKLAVDSFYNDTGQYPASLQDLVTRPSDPKISKRWRGPYTDAEPLDGWKHPFVYQLTKGGTHPYELYSLGANGETGTPEEQISVWQS